MTFRTQLTVAGCGLVATALLIYFLTGRLHLAAAAAAIAFLLVALFLPRDDASKL